MTLTTGEQRTSTYQVEQVTTGATRRVDTDASGVARIRQHEANSTWTVTAADGTVTRLVEGPDPRFGLQAPVATSTRVTMPSGLQATMTASRTATLADPANPLSLVQQTDTVTLNGRASTRVFDATPRTVTSWTPAGRQAVTTLDSLGRVSQVQPGGLEPVGYTYDLRGRLASVTHWTA